MPRRRTQARPTAPTPTLDAEPQAAARLAFKVEPATSAEKLAHELNRTAQAAQDGALALALRALAEDVEAGTPVAYNLGLLARTFSHQPVARSLVWLSRDAAALEQRD